MVFSIGASAGNDCAEALAESAAQTTTARRDRSIEDSPQWRRESRRGLVANRNVPDRRVRGNQYSPLWSAAARHRFCLFLSFRRKRRQKRCRATAVQRNDPRRTVGRGERGSGTVFRRTGLPTRLLRQEAII